MNSSKTIQNDFFFLSPQKTMDIVLEAINEIIPYELAVILSKEPDNNLKVRFAKGPLVNDKLKNFKLEVNDRPEIIAALNSGHVMLADDDDTKHKDTYDGIIELPSGHSCMLAPLQVNGKTLGLMTLDHSHCDIFTPQKVKIADSLSKLIALALAQTLAADALKNENESLIYERSSLVGSSSSVFNNMIGTSPAWLQIIEKIKLVAPTDSHVLITGETGTGKEQTAKAIHKLSGRSNKPFITLNCSALNYNLAESELFGHEKGAFTGAAASRRGRFELADGGILFLDELGDLPLEIQPKLLRAIQEGTFERLGSEKTLHSNVRIICATNADLESKVKEGKFREDLFYRLNVFPVHLPALRHRKDDIIILANFFLQNLSLKFPQKQFILLDSAVSALSNYSWPGNVRELNNTLERAAILSKDGIIKDIHLEFETGSNQSSGSISSENPTVTNFEEETKKIIIKALKQTNGKIYGSGGAAELLKIKPTTLQSKIKKLKISL